MIVVNSILLTDWHPLDHRPAPDYVPACWDGPHVGKRLAEGLRTLMLMPMRPALLRQSLASLMPTIGPICSRSRKPTPNRSSATSARQTIPGCGHPRSRLRTWSNRSAGRPVTLRERPQLIRTVQAVAVARLWEHDMEHAARRMRLPGRVVRRWNSEGLDLIARGLRSDRVRIF
jgi:hypothetical protein